MRGKDGSGGSDGSEGIRTSGIRTSGNLGTRIRRSGIVGIATAASASLRLKSGNSGMRTGGSSGTLICDHAGLPSAASDLEMKLPSASRTKPLVAFLNAFCSPSPALFIAWPAIRPFATSCARAVCPISPMPSPILPTPSPILLGTCLTSSGSCQPSCLAQRWQQQLDKRFSQRSVQIGLLLREALCRQVHLAVANQWGVLQQHQCELPAASSTTSALQRFNNRCAARERFT